MALVCEDRETLMEVVAEMVGIGGLTDEEMSGVLPSGF